jgi:hypothetical protein
VAYPGGGSGQFIKSMLIYMLSDDSMDIDFSDGTSHTYYKDYLKKHPSHHWLSGNNNPLKYKYIGNSKSTMPLVDSPKLPLLDVDQVYSNISVYKLIYVHIDDVDIPVCSANHYFKQPALIGYFTKLATELFSITDLASLTVEQQHTLINYPEVLGSYDGYLRELNTFLNSYPKQFHNTLYRIDFNDIINNTDKVKKLLETVTNKTMSTHAHTQYDRYVEKQLQFRKYKNF